MIINLRGTNGAGKSTIVRTVMSAFPVRTSVTRPDRRKPIGYLLSRSEPCRIGTGTLFTPGHYEIANGGIDTLRSLDEAYELIVEYAAAGCDVLYEGKNMSDGPRRLLGLKQRGLDARAILVSYPLDECIAAVRQRGHGIKEKTIERLYIKSFNDFDALSTGGVFSIMRSRSAALKQVLTWLHLDVNTKTLKWRR